VGLLLDTHALVWWIRANPLLSTTAKAAISGGATPVFASVASAWEIAIKVGGRGWPEAQPLLADFEQALVIDGFSLLSITVPHARTAGRMTSPHRDPFDRLLAAQAITEGLTLVTADAKVRGLGAPWVW
jgi:PIN domain nuclease of toxin-antitoxin system